MATLDRFVYVYVHVSGKKKKKYRKRERGSQIFNMLFFSVNDEIKFLFPKKKGGSLCDNMKNVIKFIRG